MVSKYKVYAVNAIDFSKKESSGEIEPMFIVAENLQAIAMLERKEFLITTVILALGTLENDQVLLDVNVIINQKDVDEKKPLKAYFTNEDSGNIFISEKPPIYPKDTFDIILEKEVDLFIPAEYGETYKDWYSNETKAE